jgi:hypothetical protein
MSNFLMLAPGHSDNAFTLNVSYCNKTELTKKLAFGVLTIPVELCHCIKILISKALSLPIIQTLYISAQLAIISFSCRRNCCPIATQLYFPL